MTDRLSLIRFQNPPGTLQKTVLESVTDAQYQVQVNEQVKRLNATIISILSSDVAEHEDDSGTI